MTKEDRHWPAYLLGGRVRTSTVALILTFALVWWLYQEYKPAPPPVEPPATQVVPPGFVPDPNYTWVPRTNVQEPRRTTTPTTPTTTETTSPTESITPSGTTTSGSPTTSPTTTTTSPTSTTSPPPGAPPTPPSPAVPGHGTSPTPPS